MTGERNPCRCRWCNEQNPLYVEYHDHEWGMPVHDDQRLYEMLLLESFQAGLSWECVLNKREAFRKAFDGYDVDAVVGYSEEKQTSLMLDSGIIRNRLKIKAAVNNARIFKDIQQEYGSFDKYIWGFTGGETVYECGKTTSPLSDRVSHDLSQRGMKFVGSTIIYSLLQAIGIINSHEEYCFLHHGRMQSSETTNPEKRMKNDKEFDI